MATLYVAPSPIAGLGLFAGQSFTEGDLVISFHCQAVSKFEWKRMCADGCIPTDAAFVYLGKMLRDPNLTNQYNTRSQPKWYYFNHSYDPNTIMKKCGPVVAWYAIRDIAADEELTFHYGEPDPSWA